MPEADVNAFNLHFESWCADRLPGLVNVKPFEFFCADQFLKARSLSDAEILAGQVDASDDGGVDSFYCFLNNVLLDDTTVIDPRSGGLVEIKIIQSKQGSGFSPTAVEKFGIFIDDLLTFSRKPQDYRYAYHEKLTRLMGVFKSKFQQLIHRSIPQLSIEFFYITRLDVEPNRNAFRAAENLVAKAATYYTETTVEPVRFVNVGRLWSQFKVAPPKIKYLPLVKSFSTIEGWVGLVTLRDYYQFLMDARPSPDGRPRIDEHIFDSNVRGYQIGTGVNTRITRTLTAVDAQSTLPVEDRPKLPPEFWLLNNGITILSPKATYSDERLAIDNPQIVNGLQTSRRIFDYCRSRGPLSEKDNRRILVRVIKTSDEATRSDIVRATNDQNPMPAEAFLSTLRLHHQIETYFEDAGLYYDRRKGHYKSLGKPAAQIVGIVDLMQAVLAIMLRRPDTARARPRDFLKEGRRQQLFGPDDEDDKSTHKPYELAVYLRCVQIVRKVDGYLAAKGVDDRTALNTRFYMALDLAAEASKNAYCPPPKIRAIDVEHDFTDKVMEGSYKRISALYRKHGNGDDAAKGTKMVAGLNHSLKIRLSPPNKSKKGATKKGGQ